MKWGYRGLIGAVLGGLSLSSLSGCNTVAAKKALNKSGDESTAFAGFDNKSAGSPSDRKEKSPEPVRDDMDPEKAIDVLVEYMQRREPAYYIPAEDEMRYWAQKQGVSDIIVQKIRPLLKNPRIEVRAPALRLTCAFGQRDSWSDMIESMSDEDYGMRKTAFESLRQRTQMDFGYTPSGGEVARSDAIRKWRAWWQDSQRTMLASKVPVGGYTAPEPPKVVRAGDKRSSETDTITNNKFATPLEEKEEK